MAATEAEFPAPAFVGNTDRNGRKRRGDEHAYPDAPICTPEDADLDIGDRSPEEAADIRAYFSNFVAPIPSPNGRGACVHCGTEWIFTWGLAHGAGHCTTCGWPARLYHFIKDRNGADLLTYRDRALQYRPMTAAEVAEAKASEAASK